MHLDKALLLVPACQRFCCLNIFGSSFKNGLKKRNIGVLNFKINPTLSF